MGGPPQAGEPPTTTTTCWRRPGTSHGMMYFTIPFRCRSFTLLCVIMPKGFLTELPRHQHYSTLPFHTHGRELDSADLMVGSCPRTVNSSGRHRTWHERRTRQSSPSSRPQPCALCPGLCLVLACLWITLVLSVACIPFKLIHPFGSILRGGI